MDSKACFQNYYETLIFEDIKNCESGTTSSLVAETQRKIIAQLYYSVINSDVSEDSHVGLLLQNQHLKRYCQIVDNRDPVKGLDNFSKGALALSSSFKNESRHWTLKDLQMSTGFQQLENELKKGNELRRENRGSGIHVSDLEKTLDHIRKPESKVEETRPGPPPSFAVKEWRQDTEIARPSPNFSPKFQHRPPEKRPETARPETSIFRNAKDQPAADHRLPEKKVEEPPKPNAFRTAKDQLIADQRKKNAAGNNVPPASYGSRPKSLGTRRGLNSPFIPPIKGAQPAEEEQKISPNELDKITDERLKNIEPKMVEMIENEIMYSGSPVTWDDIAGLEFAKKTIKEIVVWPMLRPDIFTGLRGPPRGILLFGPPGTGKTLIGKCIASQSKSTFFSISASTLTSKWVGEGEKMVRALFAVARVQQPSVIFIDEIDSLLSQRSDTEHESSRRMKTEFLVQLDGATTSQEDRLLVVGATNRPQELDEAARRRLVKRLYIPLPEFPARKQIIQLLMAPQPHHLEEDQLNDICNRTDGYSCADMTNLCKEAAYGPIRSISFQDIEHISPDQVRPITSEDFDCALLQVRASVSTQDLALYEDWNSRYGSGAK